ncbi:unnamed protein product [Closterium sp. NIES-53]
MATLSVLAFDHEGRPIQFDTWLDDLQLYLLSDSRDSVSLFDYTSGASLVPPATADSATRSQWLTRDAAARIAVRNHLPLAKRAHLSQHKTAKALYDAVVARYSSPATAALGRLILPYLFPELSAFATIEDLITHLRTSDTRYRAALPAEFLDKNLPPMYIPLYFIVTRLPDSLRAVRDHFLALDPTELTVDLLEKHLLAAETSSGGGGSGGGGGGGSGGGGGGGGGGGSGGGSGGFGGGGGGSGGSSGGGGGGSGSGGGGSGGGRGGAVQRGAWGVTFTLDSGASRCFFCDSTTLTPLPAPVQVRLGDPSGGPVLARSSTVLPCPAVPSDSLSRLHLPSFSTNLVSASGPVASPYSYHLLSHQTLLWHHHLGHPSLPRLRGMHSRLLVSSLPRSLPPLPPSPALPCLPCVEGRQRAAPHSSFPPMTAPLQTLHMDVWGPVRVNGQYCERYFLLVVDDYTRYTMVFPLCSKGEVPDLFIPWIRAVCLQLRERFREDLTVLRLHSDRGGEFSSDLLREFCRGEGILQSFTLPASPKQNGVAERRIGIVMDVARTSMIHAAAPHFLWPFAVQFAAHQLNLWPRVSLPETSPTLRWTGKVGDASVFRVIGSRAFVRDTSTDKLSSRAVPCVFLGFPPDAHGWRFYHPTSRCVLPSQDVTFDQSVPFYRLFLYRTAPLPPPPLFLAPGPPPVDPLPPQGPAPSGVSQVDSLPLAEPVEVFVDSGAARGAASGGAEPASAEPGGAVPERAEPRESGGAEPRGTASAGGPAGASPRLSHRREPLSPQKLHEWFAQHTRLRIGAAGAGGHTARGTGGGGAGATSLGGGGVTAGAGGTGGAGATGPEGTRTRGNGAAGAGGLGGAGAGDPRAGGNGDRDPGAGGTGAGAGGAGAGDPGAGGFAAGGTGAGGPGVVGAAGPGGARTRGTGAARAGGLEALELETLELGGAGAGGAGAGDPGARGAGAGDPGAGGARAGGTGAGGTVQRRPFFVPPPPSSLPPPDSVPRQVLPPSLLCPLPHPSQPQLQPHSPLPAPSPYAEQTYSLTERREPESRLALPVCAVRTSRHVPRPRPPPVPGTHIMALHRAASPTFPRLLATVVTDPSFEFGAASTLVAELVDFAAACRLDYVASLVAKSESDCPPSVGGECALGTDVLEDRQEEFECLAAAVPHLVAMLLAPEGEPDAPDIPTPHSYAEAITGTYVDAFPPFGANIFNGMWIFRVKRPPDTSSVFKARYVARGFNQREGVDFFQTFSPTPKMTTLRVLLHVAAQRDYELHSFDSSTDFLQGSLHEEMWLRRPPGFTGMTLASLGFAPSTADPSLFLRTDTLLPPLYTLVYVDDLIFAIADTEVLQRFGFRYSSPQSTLLPTGHSLSAPPSDESVEPSGPYPELVGCLITSGMGLVLGVRGPVFLTGHAHMSWVDDLATQRSSQGYTFSLGSDSVSWQSTHLSFVLSSNCEAEIYTGVMAAHELHRLTYLLTDLGERPRSPQIVYVDNKAMIALCQEHRLEHITKHIALRYFLARELQQCGQLRLAYVATRANTADIFTKALQSGDHQRFCTVLGLVPALPHLLTALLCLYCDLYTYLHAYTY